MPYLRNIEIESLAELDELLARTTKLRGVAVQSLDVSSRRDELNGASVAASIFLGCTFAPGQASELSARGALVFPKLPHLPFNPYRPTPYTADELFDGDDYTSSFDARVYAWTRRLPNVPSLAQTLATDLHDHSITNALGDWLAARPTSRNVGVMGGHAMRRADADYAAGARLAANLTESGFTLLTGGGPGAMEAANLGARFAGRPDDLDEALTMLAGSPDFASDVDGWLRAAQHVLREFSPGGETVGIPTWFYGHEPPNAFASVQAKYFSNAQREDILLHLCGAGLVYLPGAAGTVQEIFQAATGNYYAAGGEHVPPMVLVGRDYWTDVLPAWPLLSALAQGRPMGSHLYLVDEISDALDVLNLPVGSRPRR